MKGNERMKRRTSEKFDMDKDKACSPQKLHHEFVIDY
jgi:hypothetical protein